MITLAFIPAAMLIATVMVSDGAPKKSATLESTEKQQMLQKIKAKSPDFSVLPTVVKPVEKPEDEYNTILSYIKKKYKNIQEQDAEHISKYLVDYGQEHALDPKFAAAVIARESAFDKTAVSSTGAKGLGQIKDFNYKDLNINNPFNIKENVSGTTQYLKKMITNWEQQSKRTENAEKKRETEKNRIRLALASYYKGFSAVKKDEGKLDAKTNGYVQDILNYYDELVAMHKRSVLNQQER